MAGQVEREQGRHRWYNGMTQVFQPGKLVALREASAGDADMLGRKRFRTSEQHPETAVDGLDFLHGSMGSYDYACLSGRALQAIDDRLAAISNRKHAAVSFCF